MTPEDVTLQLVRSLIEANRVLLPEFPPTWNPSECMEQNRRLAPIVADLYRSLLAAVKAAMD